MNSNRYNGPEQLLAITWGESPNPRPRAFPRLDVFAFARAGDAGRYSPWVSDPCASWPTRAASRYAGTCNGRTANRALVIGNTFDPATPPGSVAMARLLARAHLLTVDGYGHVAQSDPGSCANRYVSW
jgi:TAP-like protein